MNTKVFVLALINVLTIEGLVNAGWNPQPNHVEDLESDAFATLEELRLLHETAIADAKEALEQLLTDTRILADDVTVYGIERLEAEANNVTSEIHRLEDEASQLGVDVTECTASQLEAVSELPLTVGAELEKCVSTQVNEAVRIVKSSIVIIEETIGAISVFEEDIKNCNQDEICLTYVISEMNDAKISIPENINGIALGIKAFVEGIQIEIQTCVSQKISQLTSEASVILEEVVQCVDDLLSKQ